VASRINPGLTITVNMAANIQTKTIPIEDIIHYRSKGLSTREIGKLTNCTHSNVVQRLQNVNLEGLDRFRDNKDLIIEHKQREVIQGMTDAKIKESSLLQLATTAGIFEDKIRVIRGQATDVQEHRHVIASLSEIEARCKQAGIITTSTNNSNDIKDI